MCIRYGEIGKSGSDNPGKIALSGTGILHNEAENQGSWFRVWASQEPEGLTGREGGRGRCL